MKKIAIVFMLVGSFFVSNAQQDTLWLTDGRYFIVKSVEMNQDSSYKVVVVDGEKTKEKEFGAEEMFVLHKQNGEIKNYYNPGDDELSYKEMESFVAGESFARSNYKPTVATIVNFFATAGISLYLGVHGLVFYAPLVSLVPTFVLANIKPSISKLAGKDNDVYKEGYLVAAKRKKALWLIKSGIAGLITGGGISFVIVK
jgi:hypothetical protein